MFSFANTIESLPCEKRPGARASNPLQSSGPSFFLELLLTPFPRLGKLFGNATFDGLRQTRQNNGFFCEILLRNDSPANCLPSCFSSAACNSAHWPAETPCGSRHSVPSVRRVGSVPPGGSSSVVGNAGYGLRVETGLSNSIGGRSCAAHSTDDGGSGWSRLVFLFLLTRCAR